MSDDNGADDAADTADDAADDTSTGTEVEVYDGGGHEVEPAEPTIDVTVIDLDDDGSTDVDPQAEQPSQSTSDAGPASRGGGGGGGGGGGSKRRWRKPKKCGEGSATKNEYNFFRGGDKHKTNKILSDNKGIDASGRKTPSDRRAARSTAAADRRAGRRSR